MPETDKRVALLEARYSRLETRLDEFLLRRWEVSKIVVTAVVSVIVTYLVSSFGRKP